MFAALQRRHVGRSLTAALALTAAACGQDPSAGTSGQGGSSGSSVGSSGTGGLAFGGSYSSGGATTLAAGTAGAGAGRAGLGTSGGGGAAGSSSSAKGGSGGIATAGSGGTATAGGGGTAMAGGGGTATAGGGSGNSVYSTDRATFGGQPRCQGLDVCESFESTELGALPSAFTLEGYGARKVGASADRAMRGARSLKFEIQAQGAVTGWLTRTSLANLGARHFGRAFFRIESPAPTEFVHFDLFQGGGPYGGHENFVRYTSTGTRVGTGPANWSFIYNVQPGGAGAGPEFGTEGDRSAHPRVDDWMCLEWSFDASKQVARYYLDGASIEYLQIDTERAEIPVFDSIAVGFGKYQNTGAFLVYVDEVAFDGERIGCNN